MTEVACNKGPILEQLYESVTELRADQKLVVSALVDIAKHQERLVALTDKTADTKRSVDTLYQIQREHEAHTENALKDIDTRITLHLLNHPTPENCQIRLPGTEKEKEKPAPAVDTKYDRVQVAVVIALIFFIAAQCWEFLNALVRAVKALGVPT